MSYISQLANNMDYKWNNPKTYAIFVPGLSLAIQIIQTSNILPKHKAAADKQLSFSLFLVSSAAAVLKIRRICRFNCLGALAQMTASSVALFVLSNPFMILVAASCSLLSTYQFAHITYEALVKMKLTIQNPNGSSKSANGFF